MMCLLVQQNSRRWATQSSTNSSMPATGQPSSTSVACATSCGGILHVGVMGYFLKVCPQSNWTFVSLAWEKPQQVQQVYCTCKFSGTNDPCWQIRPRKEVRIWGTLFCGFHSSPRYDPSTPAPFHPSLFLLHTMFTCFGAHYSCQRMFLAFLLAGLESVLS